MANLSSSISNLYYSLFLITLWILLWAFISVLQKFICVGLSALPPPLMQDLLKVLFFDSSGHVGVPGLGPCVLVLWRSGYARKGVLKTKTFDLWPPRLQVSLCALRMATLSVLSVLRVAFLLVLGRHHQLLNLTKLRLVSNWCVGCKQFLTKSCCCFYNMLACFEHFSFKGAIKQKEGRGI